MLQLSSGPQILGIGFQIDSCEQKETSTGDVEDPDLPDKHSRECEERIGEGASQEGAGRSSSGGEEPSLPRSQLGSCLQVGQEAGKVRRGDPRHRGGRDDRRGTACSVSTSAPGFNFLDKIFLMHICLRPLGRTATTASAPCRHHCRAPTAQELSIADSSAGTPRGLSISLPASSKTILTQLASV